MEEERKLALQPFISQSTSTSVSQATPLCVSKESVKQTPWAPPITRLIRKSVDGSDVNRPEQLMGHIAVELGTEERKLATKLNTSQNSSTSVVPTGSLHEDTRLEPHLEPPANWST